MKMTIHETISAPRSVVWELVTDIEHCADYIEGIEELEILEKPDDGLVGLKWRETRTMFGKKATEVMWITSAEAPRSYEVRAESHGSVYRSVFELQDTPDGGTSLTMSFEGIPQTRGTKLMLALTGWMFAGATKKALAKDLADIKKAAEARR